MGGALSSVLGGGNILGSLLNVAGMIFPPLQMASSLINMLNGAIGGAVKGAADALVKEAGMPKFAADMVKGVVDQALGTQQQDSNSEVDSAMKSKLGNEMNDFEAELGKQLFEKTRDDMQADAKKKGGKKANAGSWLEKLARNLGEVAGEKAAKMVELSDKLTELSGKDDKQSAKEMTAVSQELSGVSKLFQVLQDAANTTIKSIGDGLATAARKT